MLNTFILPVTKNFINILGAPTACMTDETPTTLTLP